MHKPARQASGLVPVAPGATLVFESEETVRVRLQEILRHGLITGEAAVQTEDLFIGRTGRQVGRTAVNKAGVAQTTRAPRASSRAAWIRSGLAWDVPVVG